MKDDDFIKRITQSLDKQSEALDGETLSRLNRARQAALQQLQHKQNRHINRSWIPVGGIAAAVLVTSLFMFRTQDIATIADNPADAIEIIAAGDKLELYEQLDFYLWLLEEEADAV